MSEFAGLGNKINLILLQLPLRRHSKNLEIKLFNIENRFNIYTF